MSVRACDAAWGFHSGIWNLRKTLAVCLGQILGLVVLVAAPSSVRAADDTQVFIDASRRYASKRITRTWIGREVAWLDNRHIVISARQFNGWTADFAELDKVVLLDTDTGELKETPYRGDVKCVVGSGTKPFIAIRHSTSPSVAYSPLRVRDSSMNREPRPWFVGRFGEELRTPPWGLLDVSGVDGQRCDRYSDQALKILAQVRSDPTVTSGYFDPDRWNVLPLKVGDGYFVSNIRGEWLLFDDDLRPTGVPGEVPRGALQSRTGVTVRAPLARDLQAVEPEGFYFFGGKWDLGKLPSATGAVLYPDGRAESARAVPSPVRVWNRANPIRILWSRRGMVALVTYLPGAFEFAGVYVLVAEKPVERLLHASSGQLMVSPNGCRLAVRHSIGNPDKVRQDPDAPFPDLFISVFNVCEVVEK